MKLIPMKTACAIINFWYGWNGMETVEPPLPAVGVGVPLEDDEIAFVKSSDKVPEERCCSIEASSADEPGLVLPNAQMRS